MAPSSYSPTIKDVFCVKATLRVKLPLEIIDAIIDFAEYWPHVTSRMKERMVISGSSSKEDIDCLRTPPLCYNMVRPVATLSYRHLESVKYDPSQHCGLIPTMIYKNLCNEFALF